MEGTTQTREAKFIALREARRDVTVRNDGYDSKLHTFEGVPYTALSWGTCFKLAFAFLVVFGLPILVGGCVVALENMPA